MVRGRFAPTPSGPLHFGSIVAALASCLEARGQGGEWYVRIDDLDPPRVAPGATDAILACLRAFGFIWDGEVMYQSRRTGAYAARLRELQNLGVVYPCACSRKEIAAAGLQGSEGPLYPGTCRNGMAHQRTTPAWRVRTDLTLSPIEFDDPLQGEQSQHLDTEIGDFVVKRADGLFAYQLAVVADDAFQGITHIVRGADLLTSTARQIWLQRLLGFSTPQYMHLPVVVSAAGEKLSKQTLATPVDTAQPVVTLFGVLDSLRQHPPAELARSDLNTLWDWALQHWDAGKLRGVATLPAPSV